MLRAISALVLTVFAVGASAQKTEADVRTVYARLNAASAKRDAKAVIGMAERYFAPNFTATMAGKTLTRKAYIRDIRTGMAQKDPGTMTASVTGVKKQGDRLVCSMSWVYKGKGPDGKAMVMPMKTVDVWEMTPNGYRMTRTDAK